MSSSTSSKHGHWTILLIGVLLVYTLTSTSVHSIEAADLGLTSKLPIFFWIGLILLGYLWYISKQSKYCLIAAFILTLSFLYVAPAIIKVPTWVSNSYYPFAESVLINSSGHLIDRPSAPLFSYHDWPVFLYLASVFTLITGMPHYILLKCFPLLTISLYGLLTLLILRVKLKTPYAIFGAAWFLSSFWLRQHYFGPPGIAYIFFLLILLIISWLFFDGKAKKGTLTVLFLFLFIVITLTHPLTSFMSVIALVALYVAQRFVRKQPSPLLAELCALSTIIVLSYNAFLAPSFFKLCVQRFYQSLSGIMELSLYQEPSRIIGSSAGRLNYASSWSIVLLNVVVAVIAMIHVLKNVRSRKQTIKEGYSIFWVISLVLFALFALTAKYGPHEAYQRAFMFGLVPLAYLCINLLKSKPKILLAILVGLIFLNIPAQYGSDSFRLATPMQLAGSSFFADSAPQNISCLAGFSLYVRYYDPLKNIDFQSLIALPFTSFPNSTTVNDAVNKVAYIVRSDLQDNYYLFYLGKNPLDQVPFERFNRIYDNGNFCIFKHANKTSSP